MATGAYLMGIDLGTTTCRAVIFDLNGTEVASAFRETRVAYPRPLWAEVDPEDWWTDTCAVVREAIARANAPATRIAAVGLSGLMHAPVLLDETGKPVTPAQLWMDQRCAPQADALRSELARAGPPTRLPVGTGQSAPKLRWLAERAPEILARARHFVLPKDFVRYRLTGALLTDVSDAGGTGLYDRARGQWDAEVVGRVGLPFELLPSIAASASLAGQVTSRAAEETGLAAGTPVAVGGADTLCTRLGVGILAPDEACLYLGTAAWVSVMKGHGPDGQPIIRGFGATSTTGAALRWLRDIFDPEASDDHADYSALQRAAAEVPRGAAGIFFLPHLMGERGPRPDPLARGALVGLTLHHGRPHLVRAVLEGTAFQLRRVVDERLRSDDGACALTSGVACGGGARSRLWIQILADVTSLALRVPSVVESAALGAAILGAAAADVCSTAEAATRMIHYSNCFEPRPAATSDYDRLYVRYCRLDDLLGPFFHEESP